MPAEASGLNQRPLALSAPSFSSWRVMRRLPPVSAAPSGTLRRGGGVCSDCRQVRVPLEKAFGKWGGEGACLNYKGIFLKALKGTIRGAALRSSEVW